MLVLQNLRNLVLLIGIIGDEYFFNKLNWRILGGIIYPISHKREILGILNYKLNLRTKAI